MLKCCNFNEKIKFWLFYNITKRVEILVGKNIFINYIVILIITVYYRIINC